MPRSSSLPKVPPDVPPTRPARDGRTQVTPLKQARALRTRASLLKAGRTLLQEGGFDQVSITQIAHLAGCSVGGFYFSFLDKEAFFRCLLDDVIAEVQRDSLRDLSAQRDTASDRSAGVRRCVEHFIAVARRHEGLLRTVTQHTAHNASEWRPMRDLGRWMGEFYAGQLVLAYPAAQRERIHRNAVVGMHIVMGFLLNAVLHSPEPLHLHSADVSDWLTHVLQSCLDRPADPAHA